MEALTLRHRGNKKIETNLEPVEKISRQCKTLHQGNVFLKVGAHKILPLGCDRPKALLCFGIAAQDTGQEWVPRTESENGSQKNVFWL